MQNDLPPEFDTLLDTLASMPEDVRLWFHYAIALMLIDDEKARVIEERQDDDGLHLLLQTRAGKQFEFVRPMISVDIDPLLLKEVRAILDEESEK